jgi:hypothetical protein
MLRTITSALVLLVATSTANATLFGSFKLVAANQSPNVLIYDPNSFYDTWIFQVRTTDGLNYDSLSLDFHAAAGTFFTLGPTTFKSGASNPTVFGFEVPECFFVLPPGAAPLAGTQIDTASELQSDFTTAGGLPLIPASGERVPVAFFSVKSGTGFGVRSSYPFPALAVHAGGAPQDIFAEDSPEPSSIVLAGLAILGCAGFRRRMCSSQG